MPPKDGEVWVTLKVIPKSSRNEVGEWGEDHVLKVYVTAVPEKGKANEAVKRLLAQHWGLSLHQVILVRGETSSRKVFLLRGITRLP